MRSRKGLILGSVDLRFCLVGFCKAGTGSSSSDSSLSLNISLSQLSSLTTEKEENVD